MAASFACGGLMTAMVFLSEDETATPTPGVTPSPTTVVQVPTATPDHIYPTMVSREEWGALQPNHAAENEAGFYSIDNPEGWRWYQEPLHEVYRTVVMHHSASYLLSDAMTIWDIQNTHRNQRGWADVAYHYFIGKNGDVYEGRDIHVRGAHVKAHNTGSVGVCLLGDFTKDYPTDEQIGAAIGLVQWLARGLQLTHLASHRDFELTICPGHNLIPYMDAFASNAGLGRGTGGYVMPPEQIDATATAESSACLCGHTHY